jgi:hypothetical protein
MNDASTPIGQPPAVHPPGKLAYATPTTAPLVAGRRSFSSTATSASRREQREDPRRVTIGAEGDAADGVALPRLRGASSWPCSADGLT